MNVKVELSTNDISKAIEMYLKSKGLVAKSVYYETGYDYGAFTGFNVWFTGAIVEVKELEKDE